MDTIALVVGYGVLIVLAIIVLIVLLFLGLEWYCKYLDNRERDQFLIKSELRRHAMDYTSFIRNNGFSNADHAYAAFIAHLNSHAG